MVLFITRVNNLLHEPPYGTSTVGSIMTSKNALRMADADMPVRLLGYLLGVTAEFRKFASGEQCLHSMNPEFDPLALFSRGIF